MRPTPGLRAGLTWHLEYRKVSKQRTDLHMHPGDAPRAVATAAAFSGWMVAGGSGWILVLVPKGVKSTYGRPFS